MARTLSNMLPLGTIAPSFNLLDTVSGNTLNLDDLKSDKATVVMFICNHCPYVIHINEVLVELAKEYQAKGISFVGISSNDVDNYPQDAPDKMKIHAETVGYSFPYLYDESQEVAKAYDAACTPDFYVFDKNMELVYRGQMDDSRPGSGISVTGENLKEALDAALSGQAAPSVQKPSIGCGIKWKL
jgi:thiol-disulfide isomerase/thioredoxin